jgi:hypothetical protein
MVHAKEEAKKARGAVVFDPMTLEKAKAEITDPLRLRDFGQPEAFSP